MRGVIASASEARILDITHQFPRGDIRTSAFWLREILPWFPPSVHLVVVDPGVGTDRDILVIDAGGHHLVGPDNGVLLPAARELDSDATHYRLSAYDAASATFHGRDVFAPLAARIHDWTGTIAAIPELEPTDDAEAIAFPAPTVTSNEARGEVLVIDHFGNVITNIPGSFLTPYLGQTVDVNGIPTPAVQTYGEVGRGEALVTVGSHGQIELAVRDGRGAVAFDVSKTAPIQINVDA